MVAGVLALASQARAFELESVKSKGLAGGEQTQVPPAGSVTGLGGE